MRAKHCIVILLVIKKEWKQLFSVLMLYIINAEILFSAIIHSFSSNLSCHFRPCYSLPVQQQSSVSFHHSPSTPVHHYTWSSMADGLNGRPLCKKIWWIVSEGALPAEKTLPYMLQNEWLPPFIYISVSYVHKWCDSWKIRKLKMSFAICVSC